MWFTRLFRSNVDTDAAPVPAQVLAPTPAPAPVPAPAARQPLAVALRSPLALPAADGGLASAMQAAHIGDRAIVYDRLSTGSQAGSFDTHLPVLAAYAAAHTMRTVRTITEIGSAFGDNVSGALIEAMAANRGAHLIVYDEARLARNTVAGAQLIAACKRNQVTVHVAGIAPSYACVHSSQWRRLLNAIGDAEEESETRSKRSKTYHRNRQQLGQPAANARAPFGFEYRRDPATGLRAAERAPTEREQAILSLLHKLTYGSDMPSFYTAFNLLSRWGPTEERLGGPVHKLRDRNQEEFFELERGAVHADDILALLNSWEIFPRGRVRWTRAGLALAIESHLGPEALLYCTTDVALASAAPVGDADMPIAPVGDSDA